MKKNSEHTHRSAY